MTSLQKFAKSVAADIVDFFEISKDTLREFFGAASKDMHEFLDPTGERFMTRLTTSQKGFKSFSASPGTVKQAAEQEAKKAQPDG